MNKSRVLKRILEEENKHGLYKFKIGSITIWNLYRTLYRYRYISNVTSIPSITNRRSKRVFIKNIIINSFQSARCFINVLVNNTKVDNVIISFGRLQTKDGISFDKFSDPVIDASEIKKSCCIFELPHLSSGIRRRRHNEMILPLDFLMIVIILMLPFYGVWFIFSGDFLKIHSLYRASRKLFPMKFRDILLMYYKYVKFREMSLLYKVLFKRLEVKRIMGAGRQRFMDASYAAHKLKIPVYEFQHGVTYGDSAYYSGPQCYDLDPDYFLSFGEMWKGNQFGIDSEKIINIGWAYKDEFYVPQDKIIDKSVLFISSPEISPMILETAKEMANTYPSYKFYIRCHPYEKYTKEQEEIVNNICNLYMDDNSIDSMIALNKYQYVIGENSTMVYEALSIGKITGRICYNGIESVQDNKFNSDGFVYLYKVQDFQKMIQANLSCDSNLAYSNFKPEIVNGLPKRQ